MRVTKEIKLRDFEFWAGAKQIADWMSPFELDEIEEHVEALYPQGMSETEINDLFWFDNDWIAELLGFADWEAYLDDNEV